MSLTMRQSVSRQINELEESGSELLKTIETTLDGRLVLSVNKKIQELKHKLEPMRKSLKMLNSGHRFTKDGWIEI